MNTRSEKRDDDIILRTGSPEFKIKLKKLKFPPPLEKSLYQPDVPSL